MQTVSVDLNEKQKQAAEHVEGPMLVLAGAGSGKTRIVVARILHLLSLGIPSSEIIALTFTNKAAGEMQKRILHLAKALILTCTFHSLCAKILRESISALGYKNDFLIADEEDSEKTLKQAFASLGIKEDKDLLKNTKRQISQAKSQLLFPHNLTEDLLSVKEVYTKYASLLKQYNTLDFDDLLLLTVDLLQKFPDILSSYQARWRFILVDEYQDTNHAQYLLLKLLAGSQQNVFAVGDPDQSIYSWRGANIDNILHFEEDYEGAKVVRLEQNYRSPSNILEAANALIAHNERRYKKELWSTLSSQEKISIFIASNERKEADFIIEKIHYLREKENIPYEQMCIFYRTNFQSRSFEDALLREKVPYIIIGGLSFYQRREIKDILSLLRMILSDHDFIAFARTLNIPKKGLGSAALDKIKALLEQEPIGIFCLCQKIAEGRTTEKFTPKQMQGIGEYVKHILALRNMNVAQRPLHEIVSSALERFRYLEYLQEDLETYAEKKANVEELISKAMEWEAEAAYPTLSAFLEELSLKSSSEHSQKDERSVRLMTLHNGKGLEFPVVFLVGMEEDLFPHVNAKDSSSALEEERRLCYVGITRSQGKLFLSAAKERFLWGYSRPMRPSRFLKEIPSIYLNNLSFKTVEKESTGSFTEGDAVFHKDFGSGIVQKAYQTSLGLTYDVFFQKTKTMRSLVDKYAKLQKDENTHY
jgi:DNA helicase-2/ATP-dependent DNA helicase PcrA